MGWWRRRYSTVGDLFRWNERSTAGVINQASLQLAPPRQVARRDHWHELRLWALIFKLKGLPAIGHGGGLNGWSAIHSGSRTAGHRRRAANSMPSPPEHHPGAISHKLAERFLADDIKKLPALVADQTVDPKLRRLHRRYDYKTGILTVTLEMAICFSSLPISRGTRFSREKCVLLEVTDT